MTRAARCGDHAGEVLYGKAPGPTALRPRSKEHALGGPHGGALPSASPRRLSAALCPGVRSASCGGVRAALDRRQLCCMCFAGRLVIAVDAFAKAEGPLGTAMLSGVRNDVAKVRMPARHSVELLIDARLVGGTGRLLMPFACLTAGCRACVAQGFANTVDVAVAAEMAPGGACSVRGSACPSIWELIT